MNYFNIRQDFLLFIKNIAMRLMRKKLLGLKLIVKKKVCLVHFCLDYFCWSNRYRLSEYITVKQSFFF